MSNRSAVIKRTIEAIQGAEPERFQMSEFFTENSFSCSTAACVAGWVAIANYEYEKPWIDTVISSLWDIKYDLTSTTTEALGITEDEARELFYLDISKQAMFDLLNQYGVVLPQLSNFGEYQSRLATIVIFDFLPAKFRKQAAINVLTILRDEGRVSWNDALKRTAEEVGLCQAWVDNEEKLKKENNKNLT